jgi:WhiB family transcriptional regulator, redox-sensing transcriptional regulator
MTMTAESCSWWELAACQRVNTELFFPVTESGPARAQVARAKAVCARCLVRENCLDYAMSTHQAHGVWGGLSAHERRSLRAQRGRRDRLQINKAS